MAQGFSQAVREEIARVKFGKCRNCLKAELAAFLHVAGSLHLVGREKIALSISLESPVVTRRLLRILKVSYIAQTEVRVEQVGGRLGKQYHYLVYIPPQEGMNIALYELGMFNRDNTIRRGVPTELIRDDCCRASFLRGAFLAGGSISDPQKQTYHMEIVTSGQELGEGIVYLMNISRINAKLGLRKGKNLVYVKDSDSLATFLSLVNAYQGVMKLEEVRVIKSLREGVNRLVNCETANLKKISTSSTRQVEEINFLIKHRQFRLLSANLQETAQLRLDYPDSSLKELAASHRPPVSKSAVNHRLREISRIASEIMEKE